MAHNYRKIHGVLPTGEAPHLATAAEIGASSIATANEQLDKGAAHG